MKTRLNEIKKSLINLQKATDVDDEAKEFIFNDLKIEWLIETIKSQQAEIDSLSMAHDDMHRLLPKDKHFLIKSNINLNRKVQELEEEYEKELKNTIRKKNRHLRKKDKRIKKLEWDNMIHRRGHSDLYATLYSLRKELEEKGIETEF